MVERKNRLDMQVEKTENLVNYLLKKKRQNIQNSLVRPLYQEALRSLFFVCILLLDTLVPLELYRSLPNPFNIAVSLTILGVFLYTEVTTYNMLWGKKGRWSLEKYKKLPEKPNEKQQHP